MKKILVFSLLLLMLAITASCGGKSEPSVYAPSPMTIKSGQSVTFGFSCRLTGIVLPSITGSTITKVEPCNVRFDAQKTGKYEITVTATADSSKTATAIVNVVPDPKIVTVVWDEDSGTLVETVLPVNSLIIMTRFLPDEMQEPWPFWLTGAQVEESIDAGANVEWSVTSYDKSYPVGTVEKTDEIGWLTPVKLGGGILEAKITDRATGLASTASIKLSVVPDVYIDGPETVEPGGAPQLYALAGTVADESIPPFTPPAQVASMPVVSAPWANVSANYPALDELGIPLGANVYSMTPSELATVAFVGVWPVQQTYTPLDAMDVPVGAYVYGGYSATLPAAISGYTTAADISTMTAGQWAAVTFDVDFGFATFTYNYLIIYPKFTPPAGIDGYTEVAAANIPAMAPGQWAAIDGGFGYVVLGPSTTVEWSVKSDNDLLEVGSIDAWGFFTPGIFKVKGVITAAFLDTQDVAPGDKITVSLQISLGSSAKAVYLITPDATYKDEQLVITAKGLVDTGFGGPFTAFGPAMYGIWFEDGGTVSFNVDVSFGPGGGTPTL
ncbi:MAG: hypothetical protein FWF13_03805, partial [Acidobacteria bacterium]|nr:hypothetical protein [Acidobacteriota bacterium]